MSNRLAAFFVIIIIGTAGIVAAYLLRPRLFDREQLDTSDASRLRGTIEVGVDNWIGYFPLCGREFRKRMHEDGLLVKCHDDNSDLPSRAKKLKSGELQFAVATVDTYLLHGARSDYFGGIVAVIDESAGGDAIVARKSKVSNLEGLKLAPDSLRVALTPGSPSDHLLRSVAAHFDVPWLRERSRRLEVEGSSQAFAALKSDKADVAVLWEPDVSRALADKSFVKILGTENTRRLIVDVLVVNRAFAQSKPEQVQVFVSNYFRALKLYRDNPERLLSEVVSVTGLQESQATAMLKGVRWVSLSENASEWLGVGADRREGLVDSIESTARILVENGDFRESPVPSGDPYRLQNRSFVQKAIEDGQSDASAQGPGGVVAFAPLTDFQWDQLSEVGSMRVRPIAFQSGTSELSVEGKSELDAAWQSLVHYPKFRVVVRGHTGLNGDPQENARLSQDRADAVKKYLSIAHATDDNRIRAQGLGSSRPLERRRGESDRAYEYRLPRVEIHLLSEAL